MKESILGIMVRMDSHLAQPWIEHPISLHPDVRSPHIVIGILDFSERDEFSLAANTGHFNNQLHRTPPFAVPFVTIDSTLEYLPGPQRMVEPLHGLLSSLGLRHSISEVG